MRRHRLLLLFVAVLLDAGPSSADVATEAEFFDVIGRRAYESRQFEKAIESFQLVQEIAPSYRNLYNVALCADLAGRSDMAFSLYGEYLRSGDPDTERRAEAERRSEGLKSKLALVELHSEPARAIVYVDRKELGQFGSTPTTIALPEGEHELLIERAGFVSESAKVVTRAGSIVPIDIALKPLFGWIAVRTSPDSADLRFLREGVSMSSTSEHGRYRLPVGPYRVVATEPGYLPAEAHVVVREAGGALDLVLVPKITQTGRLLVSTGRVAADLFLDGKRVAVTPVALARIGVGEHEIEVRAGRRGVRRRIIITKGRATHVELDVNGGLP